jgi:hypothetical protein
METVAPGDKVTDDFVLLAVVAKADFGRTGFEIMQPDIFSFEQDLPSFWS